MLCNWRTFSFKQNTKITSQKKFNHLPVPASKMLQLLLPSIISGLRTVDILQSWLISLENNQRIIDHKNGRWLQPHICRTPLTETATFPWPFTIVHLLPRNNKTQCFLCWENFCFDQASRQHTAHETHPAEQNSSVQMGFPADIGCLGGWFVLTLFQPRAWDHEAKARGHLLKKTIESFLLISAHTHAHASHRINTDHLPTWRSKKKSRLFLLFGRSDRSGNQHYRCGTILMLDGERAKRSRWFCWPEFDSWWLLCFSGCVVRAYGLSGHHLLIKAMMVTPTPCWIRVRRVDLESAIAGGPWGRTQTQLGPISPEL